MPRDSSGNYTLPQAPFVAHTLAKAVEVNANFSDIATALTDSQSRSNPSPAAGDLNMNGQDIVNLGQVVGDVIATGKLQADHVTASRNAVNGGLIASAAAAWSAGFVVNSSGTLYWGDADAAGNLASSRMTLDVAGTLAVSGGITAPTVSSGGNVTAAGNITAAGNVSASNSVLGDHLLAFRAGGYGGVIGSWETGTGRGAGFRLNASTTTLEFGQMDPGSGNLTTVAASLNNAGTFTTGNVVATGTVSGATVSSSGNVTANGTVAGAALASSGNLAVAGVADITGKLVVHQGLKLSGIAPYANNAAALAGGLAVADVYFNTTSNALSIVL
jgi:cytoskeletal protein CcmA (bactofilin family)